MNRWALMLQQSPPELQRLIARTQRVSLPRGCDAAERLRRLRRALCSSAAVRSTYALLDSDTRKALEVLRQRRGGVRADELVGQFGPIRSLRHMARDPRPQSIAERLLLLGWLLPRPAAPHHPPRYALSPELRRALPHALTIETIGMAPNAPLAPAVRASVALLLVCAATPLAVRADGRLRRSALRSLMPLFDIYEVDELGDLYAFVLPLLRHLGLVVCSHGRCTITPGAATFLALPHSNQCERLTNAWIALPSPDRWLVRLRLALRGVDWPLLRQRLIVWVNALPAGRLVAPDTLYDTLAAAFGPLADAQTHGFRTIRRTPWQLRNAACAFLTALRKPLAWLGIVAWHHQYVYRPTTYASVDAGWRYERDGEVFVPFSAAYAALQIAPYIRWVRGYQDGLTFRVALRLTSAAKPALLQQSMLRQLLLRYAGPPPARWGDNLFLSDQPPFRLFDGVLLVAETPDDLARAMRERSVRRYVRVRLAPGIALIRRSEQTLAYRALARKGMSVVGDVPEPAYPTSPPGVFSPGDCAALAMACAFYRRYAPGDMPLTVDEQIETQLRAALPPPLRATLDEAVMRLERGQPPFFRILTSFPSRPASDVCMPDAAGIVLEEAGESVANAPNVCASDAVLIADHPGDNRLSSNDSSTNEAYLQALRRALAQHTSITVDYDTGGVGSVERRTIRPLELEQRGDSWYVRAYCLRRQAERTFRIDRIRGIGGMT